MKRRQYTRSLCTVSEWERHTKPPMSAPLILVTGICLMWWALSLLLSPFWLTLRQPEHGILDDIWSLGDGQ